MNAVCDVAVKGLQWSDDGYAALSGVLLDKAIELDGIIRWRGVLNSAQRSTAFRA